MIPAWKLGVKRQASSMSISTYVEKPSWRALRMRFLSALFLWRWRCSAFMRKRMRFPLLSMMW